MRKFIFILLIISIIFVSCNDTHIEEVKIFSPNGIESTVSFEDFFNYEIIVKDNNDTLRIIVDKNTDILYIMSYHYGISPMYDSDGTIMTKEKWFAKRFEKKN